MAFRKTGVTSDSVRAAVSAAVGSVVEPELRRSLDDLGMIRHVEVSRGRVRVQVALPIPERARAERLERELLHAVAGIDGVERFSADWSSFTEPELADLRTRLEGPRPGAPGSRVWVIAVASGKGGVGKSSVAVNLALQFARAGRATSIMDADVWGFSIPRMMGVESTPSVIDRLIVPPVAYGVSTISMGFFVDEEQPVIWRGPMLHKALEQFLTDVYWGDTEILVIDMPPGTGDVSLSISQFVPDAEVVVVTTPQPAAQKVAQRAAAMARKVNLRVIGVVENMSWFTGDDGVRYDVFGRGGGTVLADELEVPLLGQIPLVRALREGGDTGRPISATEPASEPATAFATIAERLLELAPKKRRNPALVVRPAGP